MKSTMNLLGLYQFDSTLFDDFMIPADLDKQIIINNLLLETAELELLYPDFNLLKFAIGVWSQKEKPVWEKLLSTTKYVYNPIYNYDRMESYTDTRDLKGSQHEIRDLAGTNDVTEIPNITDTITTGGENTTTSSRAGFDSETLLDQERQVAALGSTQTTSKTGTTDTNTNSTDTGTDHFDTTDTGTITHEAHLQGNIGVTSTQDMIKQEREISEFNIIDYIINSFIKRFCLLIY